MNAELITQVANRLRKVIDPETGADVMRMRLIEDLVVNQDGIVSYTFRPSSPLCPLAVTLGLQIKQSIASVPGVVGQKINVEGYVDAEGLTELLRDD